MSADPALKDALCWKGAKDDNVVCSLCAHRCIISPSERGKCGVRQNVGGDLKSLNYGLLVAANIDPIEKKPLYHFLPGTDSYSIACAGCNFTCGHCQNYTISQLGNSGRIPGSRATPEGVIKSALATGARSISYTYTEPTIFFEFALDCMKLAHKAGLKNVFVTNGFMTSECLELALPYLDGANVDLKSFSDDFYREICSGRVGPVKRTIEAMGEGGVWVEVTTLVIPGENDSVIELNQIAKFIVSMQRSIVWHVTGFYPTFKMTETPPTDAAALIRAREIGLAAGIEHVYCGNRPGAGGEDTRCDECDNQLIIRRGFASKTVGLTPSGQCKGCGTKLAGVF